MALDILNIAFFQAVFQSRLSDCVKGHDMIYLASQSPRRKALLEQLGIAYQQLNCSIDEHVFSGEQPGDYVLRMATEKLEAGRKKVFDCGWKAYPVLAADTIVVLDDAIFGKPRDPGQAFEMLMALSGRTHEVMTAVAVTSNSVTETALSVSQVTISPLSEALINDYVSSGEPFDKAGAYAIQCMGGAFVEGINGNYSGIVGLPLNITAELLERVGVSCWQSIPG